MPQRGHFDKHVLRLLKDNLISVNTIRGFIYGQKIDINGRRKVIGFKDAYGHCCFTIKKRNKCFYFSIPRAVYLAKHKRIPKGFIVAHLNKNLSDNRLKNLFLKKDESTRKPQPQWWTNEDLKFLTRNYKKMSYSRLAIKLKRSIKAIRHKVKNLYSGKPQNKRKWTLKDDKKLSILYQKKGISVKEIAKKMNKTEGSIRLRASRFLGLFRKDRLLREIGERNFYNNLKRCLQHGTALSKCCLCNYSKHIQLHHIDRDHQNHHISNIATLCPTHHVEVEYGEYPLKKIYAIWKRVYSDNTFGPLKNNLSKIKQSSV